MTAARAMTVLPRPTQSERIPIDGLGISVFMITQTTVPVATLLNAGFFIQQGVTFSIFYEVVEDAEENLQIEPLRRFLLIVGSISSQMPAARPTYSAWFQFR